ncbi:13006_t:CDS:1, partial [Cetraspora pellucida]
MSNNIDHNLIAVGDCSVNKKSKSGGRPRGEIWNAYTVEQKNGNYYSIRCDYCSKRWKRGIPNVMESHLANECSSCSQD